ncbi:sensor histidine kinase [Croceimicrobium sp.]|uniref:sensor histidine kinase n=1 Tax=Croceimicrobium sp. TaxID=2828340 RepID=UPI003BA9BE9F
MNLSFKDRIAFYYLVATSALVALAFLLVYGIVYQTVYDNMDRVLSIEAYKHTTEVIVKGDSIHFINKGEWEEREHREAQVLPVFIQLMNSKGDLMDKSPNLKDQQLLFRPEYEGGHHFDASLNDEVLRQIQIPLRSKDKLQGYIIAAMSMQASIQVLRKLAWAEAISFPVVLISLFYITRSLADRSIKPIKEITRTARRTSKRFLDERVPLPEKQDELYDLSKSINALLDRLQHAFQGEKQFSSDASHELRTPLATLRGSLEVLIRKPRSQEEYETTIKSALLQIDRMADLSDQLLVLARMDSEALNLNPQALGIVLEEVLSSLHPAIQAKNLEIHLDLHQLESEEIPGYFGSLIFQNLIGNAVKYSPEFSTIRVEAETNEQGLSCSVCDQGPGISKEEQSQIFQAFYRSPKAMKNGAPGSGLGLSIAQRAAEAIEARIELQSEPSKGTCFKVHF